MSSQGSPSTYVRRLADRGRRREVGFTVYLMIRDAASAGALPQAPHDFFNEIKSDSHLYQGITDATMSHGEGWHFGHLGRLMERADQTSRILDVVHSHPLPGIADSDSPIDDIQWSAGLKSASAFEMYR